MEQSNYPDTLNPFTAIWLSTRKAVRFIIEEKSDGFIWLLVALAGITSMLLGSFDMGSSFAFPSWVIVVTSIIAGPILGVVVTAVGAAIFWLIGKLFKGIASYTAMFRALAASQIPYIWLLPVLLVWVLASPETFLSPDLISASETGAILFAAGGLLFLVFSIWNIVIQCKAIGEAHQFSAWFGLAVVMIPAFLFFVLIIAVIILFIILGASFT